MRRTFTWAAFVLLLVGCWSCKQEVNYPDPAISRPQSITGLRRVTQVEGLQFGPTTLKGVVISDAAAKNTSQSELIVQEEGKDAAIVLQLDAAHQFAMGTEVEINLEGSRMRLVDNELQVENLRNEQIKATGRVVLLAAKSTNLPSLELNAVYWGPILVKLEKVTISGGQQGKLSGELSLNDGLGIVYSRVAPGADFSHHDAPEKVEVYAGILRLKGERMFIDPRNIDDIQIGLKELLEDFEGVVSTVYDVKTLAFKTGPWIIDGGITANTTADPKNGLQSIRLQGTIDHPTRTGIISMGFDLTGVKRLRIAHGIYPAAAEVGNVNPTTLDVEASFDGGNTYQLLQQIEVDIKSAVLKTDEIMVNAAFGQAVRFRIVNSSAPFSNKNRPRVNVDDVLFIF